VTGTVYSWTRDHTSDVSGIPATGSGDISGSLINASGSPITVSFTITPSYTNGGKTCTGTPITATVIVPTVVAASSSVANALNGTAYPMNGQEIQTIYLNYPSTAQSETMSVASTGGNGGNTYTWTKSTCNGNASTMAPLSGTNSATTSYTWSPTVSDVCTGNGNNDNVYIFTVTVSDANGCSATTTKKLNVVNPYTSTGDVAICHRSTLRGQTLSQQTTVAPSQVSLHLGHGDYLGNCAVFNGVRSTVPEPEAEQQVAVYPNPNNGVFVLELSFITQGASIMITDVEGKVVATKTIAKDATPVATFDLSALARGMYLIQVRDGELNYRTKIVVQ
jgi:hypothetical protein